MHCGSCVKRVTQALAAVEGVVVNEVRVGAARLTSSQEHAPVELALAALAKARISASFYYNAGISFCGPFLKFNTNPKKLDKRFCDPQNIDIPIDYRFISP